MGDIVEAVTVGEARSDPLGMRLEDVSWRAMCAGRGPTTTRLVYLMDTHAMVPSDMVTASGARV